MLRIILQNNIRAHEIFAINDGMETGKFKIHSSADHLFNLFLNGTGTLLDSGEQVSGYLSWIISALNHQSKMLSVL
jgi:hypothetical protein